MSDRRRNGNDSGESDPGPDPQRDSRDESHQIANEERRRNTAFVSGLVTVIGAWVVLSVFVYDVSQAAFWNNVVVGATIALAGGYNYYRQHNDVPLSVGVAALVATLGIWLIVAAAVLEMLIGVFWSTLVSGLLVAGLAGYNAYEAREASTVATDPDAGAS